MRRRPPDFETISRLNLLEAILDTIPSPVFFQGDDGVLSGWNDRFAEQILGVAPDDGRLDSPSGADQVMSRLPRQIAAASYVDDRRRMTDDGTLVQNIRTRVSGQTRTFVVHRRLVKGDPSIGAVGVMVDVTDRVFAEEELRRMAYTDALTGVAARRRFFEVADLEVERARRYRRPVGLIVFDLDDFKSVNDRYGHQVGDEVLKRIGSLSLDAVRESDVVGRYGGEEFALVLPETDRAATAALADRLRVAFNTEPIPTDHEAIHISASFGVSAYDPNVHTPENAPGLDELIRRADDAVRAAKAGGKNQVQVESVA